MMHAAGRRARGRDRRVLASPSLLVMEVLRQRAHAECLACNDPMFRLRFTLDGEGEISATHRNHGSPRTMKICIPALDGPALGTRLSPHFGRAPWLVVFDNETGEIETVPNEPEECSATHCVSVKRLDALGIDAVVCGGMGKRSLANFENAGMAVFLSKQGRVWEVFAEIQSGKVRRLRTEDACESGHHH